MSNREPDGRSKEVDFANLGRPRVKALLESGNSGWTPHQESKAREWIENENARDQAEAAEMSRKSLDVGRDGLSVMRIGLWASLVGLVIAFLAWKAAT